jgi:hypothetical protein
MYVCLDRILFRKGTYRVHELTSTCCASRVCVPETEVQKVAEGSESPSDSSRLSEDLSNMNEI